MDNSHNKEYLININSHHNTIKNNEKKNSLKIQLIFKNLKN